MSDLDYAFMHNIISKSKFFIMNIWKKLAAAQTSTWLATVQYGKRGQEVVEIIL